MNVVWRNWCLFLGITTLSACQSGGTVDELNLSSSLKPITIIATIGKSMHRCWFKSGNAGFKKFRLANETNSYAGRPRLLLVPRNNPAGLPLLVVQAERKNGATQISAFGPLLSTNAGMAISTDLKNWAAGNSVCKT